MTHTETVVVGGTPHEIEVRPLTLIIPGPTCHEKIEYPNRLALDYEACIYHMDRVQKFDDETPELFKIVFPDFQGEVTPDRIRKREGAGAKHVAGRLDLTIKLMKMGTPIAWQYPEVCLHPRAQLNITDVLIKLIKRFQYEDMTTDTLVDEVLKDKP